MPTRANCLQVGSREVGGSAPSQAGETTEKDRRVFDDRIGFMGGAAVAYLLASRSGELLVGDTFAQFGLTGGKIAELLKGRNFDAID